LFGAGKSATVLIDYFLDNAITENWKLVGSGFADLLSPVRKWHIRKERLPFHLILMILKKSQTDQAIRYCHFFITSRSSYHCREGLRQIT